MRWIIESSLKLRFLILALIAVLVFFGVSRLSNLPVDTLPEFAPPTVEVQTEALGLSAEEVESLITVPLEADLLAGVAWLESISSQSITGLSSILLVFEPGTDIIRARQMVQERLTQAHALPNVSAPPVMLNPLSSSSRVMMIGLSSDELPLIDLSVLARWNIKPKLTGVPGVANVAIWGQRERQLQVLVDPKKLQANGVSLQQIISTSGNALWVSPLGYLNASYPGTGGWIDTPNQRLGIRHLQPISTPANLAQVAVEDALGLTLGDVTTITEDHQPLIGDAVIKDKPGLLLLVEKLPGADTTEVTRGVEEAVALLAPGLQGVDFGTEIFQPASYLSQAKRNLVTTALISSVLVALVLLGLFSWRGAVVGIIVIPLAIFSALLVLYYRGATLNAMVLAGLLLALAAVIDDAVLSVESIRRRLVQARTDGSHVPVAKVVLGAVLETRRPVIFATLTLLVAVVPVYVLTGLTGAFLSPVATSYVLAAAASLLIALIVTPALSLILFAKTPESTVAEGPKVQDSRLAGWLRNRVGKAVFEKPMPVFAAAAALVLLALIASPRLRQASLLPTFAETNLLVRLVGEPGTSQEAMSEIASQMTTELRALSGVKNVVAHVGRAITSDRVVDVDTGELWIDIDPSADYDATLKAVQTVAQAYPNFTVSMTTYLQDVVAAAKPKPGDTLTVRVFGDELSVLESKADEVNQVLSGIDGVATSQVESLTEKPNLEIEVDLAKAEQYGLKPGDVRRAAATLLSGIRVGNLFEDQKVFDVVVWGTPEIRIDIEGVKALLIDAPAGGQVRLDEVAAVGVVPTFDTVQRQGVSRYLDVIAKVDGRKLRDVANDINASVDALNWPIEFHAEILDDYADRLAARTNFFGFLVAAIIGFFLLQQAAFRSWRLAGAACVSALVATSGAVLVALLAGAATVGVVAGGLAVLTLAVRQSVALISHYQQLQTQLGRDQGQSADLMMRAVRGRIVPVLTSIVALGAAVLPVVFFGDRAGLEVIRPVALVILGGLATTTFTNLFVLPALLLRSRAQPEHELELGATEAWIPGLEPSAND